MENRFRFKQDNISDIKYKSSTTFTHVTIYTTKQHTQNNHDLLFTTKKVVKIYCLRNLKKIYFPCFVDYNTLVSEKSNIFPLNRSESQTFYMKIFLQPFG